jgi:hypothetical protein
MEEDSLVLALTIFERAKLKGVRKILFSSKKKTIGLIGPAPDIYSREVN